MSAVKGGLGRTGAQLGDIHGTHISGGSTACEGHCLVSSAICFSRHELTTSTEQQPL